MEVSVPSSNTSPVLCKDKAVSQSAAISSIRSIRDPDLYAALPTPPTNAVTPYYVSSSAITTQAAQRSATAVASALYLLLVPLRQFLVAGISPDYPEIPAELHSTKGKLSYFV